MKKKSYKTTKRMEEEERKTHNSVSVEYGTLARTIEELL